MNFGLLGNILIIAGTIVVIAILWDGLKDDIKDFFNIKK